jgi:tetratricopeptide (TPR) repeat protein
VSSKLIGYNEALQAAAQESTRRKAAMELNHTQTAILLTKRQDIRDAVRQALKSQGLKADSIHNVLDQKQCLEQIHQHDYAIVVLDWEYGVDRVQGILEKVRQATQLESHPVFLLAAKDDPGILAAAKEYFIQYVAIGEVTFESIRDQVKGLVRDYLNVSPIRKMLMAVETARRSNQDDVVQDMLERLLAKQPDNQRVVIELAEFYIHKNVWEKAEVLLKSFADQPAPQARIKHLYARCCLKKGDHEGAIAALQGAQLLSPYNFERLLEMGSIFLNLDRPEEAEQSFGKALELAPNSKKAKLGKSTSKLLMGEINEALQLMQGVASPRELGAVFNTAAVLAIKSQRFDAGFELYQKAGQILFKNHKLASLVHYNMGIGYVKANKLDKGLKCFQKAAETDPEFIDAKHNLKVLTAALTAAEHGAKVDAAAPESSSEKDQLSDLDEKLNMSIPMLEIRLDQHVEEDVELDDVITDLGKVC